LSALRAAVGALAGMSKRGAVCDAVWEFMANGDYIL
jgi:hypothetical protein